MRLNVRIRAEITANATKALRERRAVLDRREYDLCARCYDVAIPAAVRTHIKAIMEFGGKVAWFELARSIQFNVAGETHALKADTNALAVPYRFGSGYNYTLGNAITLDKHADLVDDVRTLAHDWAKYKADLDKAERTLKTLLKHSGSTESLFKVWPEGAKFYSTPPLTPTIKVGVPALLMQDVNKILGLTS